MADLPSGRTLKGPPFINCGVDMFGPFLIKEGREELGRYGVLFICLVSKAVYIESTDSIDEDSFIQALWRFVTRRGNIKVLPSENGSNFLEHRENLKIPLTRWIIKEFHAFSKILAEITLLVIETFHHPITWGEFGRAARNILLSLSNTHGRSLNDESLRTLET